MIKLKMDQTQGAQISQSASGLEAQRIGYITGITDLHDALAHPNLPRIGQAHPTLQNLVVRDITAKPDGPNAAVITITYDNPSGSDSDLPQVKVGSTLQQQTTETDLAGNRITVAYSDTGDDADTVVQAVRVAVMRPQTELSFTRLETAHPATTARTYTGTVNRTAVFDAAAGTWLCTAITGNSSDGGKTFLVTYLFQFNADGWQPIVSYTDPKTNRPPADLADGLGIKQVTLYRQTEFKNLRLGS